MTTYTLPSGKASATDEVSGGYLCEVTTPSKPQLRNEALCEAMQELLKMQKRIAELENRDCGICVYADEKVNCKICGAS